MNARDFLRLGVPLSHAPATDLVSKFILGGDESRLYEEVGAMSPIRRRI